MINFNPVLLAPYFRFQQKKYSSNANQDIIIAAANASRVALIISNTIGTPIYLGFGQPVTGVGFGIELGSATPFVLDFATFGIVVGQEIHSFCTIAQDTVVLEVFFSPPGGA